MKLSIFTTATRPYERGDLFDEALSCYKELADEVIVNDRNWPKEFSWEHIGRAFQKGYEACSGDYVVHADLDFIFHENDFEAIRQACEANRDAPALSFWKYQFILPDRYNIKSRLVIAVNKGKYGNRIRFDSGGDLSQPSLDGQYIKPSDVPEAGVAFYNHEKLVKTKEQVMDDVGRMARAWQRHFGDYKLGGPDNELAYQEWLNMVIGRYHKPAKEIKLSEHPKFIQDTIKNLRSDQWGWDGFGNLQRNNYAQSNMPS